MISPENQVIPDLAVKTIAQMMFWCILVHMLVLYLGFRRVIA